MTEREKMALGLWYDANFDPELCAQRDEAAALCLAFNNTDPRDTQKRARLQKQLLPNASEKAGIAAPFQTDYGYNCYIGAGTGINRGAYLMDGAKITIGENCFIGPNCGMYTANHPLCYAERNRGFEQAEPITIGDNVWIGGDVTILPRVTIRSGGGGGAGRQNTLSAEWGMDRGRPADGRLFHRLGCECSSQFQGRRCRTAAADAGEPVKAAARCRRPDGAAGRRLGSLL